MAETLKVLGQSAPAATTDTTLYTAPAATEATVSTITVCNRGTSGTALFRIAVRPVGAAISNEHYLYYDASLAGGATVAITVGITLAATDVVTVRTDTATLSFSAFGVEVS